MWTSEGLRDLKLHGGVQGRSHWEIDFSVMTGESQQLAMPISVGGATKAEGTVLTEVLTKNVSGGLKD